MKRNTLPALAVISALSLTGCSPGDDRSDLREAREFCLIVTAEEWPDGVSATWSEEPVTVEEACDMWESKLGEDEFTSRWLDSEFRLRQRGAS